MEGSFAFPKSNMWLIWRINSYLSVTQQGSQVKEYGGCLGMTGIWMTYFVNAESELYLKTMKKLYLYVAEAGDKATQEWIDEMVNTYVAYQEPWRLQDAFRIGYQFTNQSPIRATAYLKAKNNPRAATCCSAGASHVIASLGDFESYLNAFVSVSRGVSGPIAFIIQNKIHAIGVGYHQGAWSIMDGYDAEPCAGLNVKDVASRVFESFDPDYNQDQYKMLMSVRVFSAQAQMSVLNPAINNWYQSTSVIKLSEINGDSVGFAQKKNGFTLLRLALKEGNSDLLLAVKRFNPHIGTVDNLTLAITGSSLSIIEVMLKCNIGSVYQMGFSSIIELTFARSDRTAVLSLILAHAKQDARYSKEWHKTENIVRGKNDDELTTMFIKHRPIVMVAGSGTVNQVVPLSLLFSTRNKDGSPPSKKICLPRPLPVPRIGNLGNS